jgi:Spy/CpxP family protein refolding chaperone
MKKRKKYLIAGAIILSVLVLTGLGLTAAYGPQGCWYKGYRHGFHSDDMADFVLWKMDRHVKELSLDEAQMQQYEEIKEQVKTTITAAMERRRQFRDMVHNEMSKENPDLNALAVDVKKRLQTMPEVIGENIDLFLGLYNVLNPEQKAQLIEMFRSRMG